MTEIEVKIRIEDVKAVREKLLGLGAVVARERHLEENVLFDFDPPSLHPARRALRLRMAGRRATLTFKGEPRKSRSFKVREEFETQVEAQGKGLSAGQRQRIAIARAVIRDTPILILDEPTAGLDAVSEQAVMEALNRLMQGRTSVVIAHRLGTVRHADVIFVIKDCELAEQGTHETLVAQEGGLYRRMYALQFKMARAATSRWTFSTEPALARLCTRPFWRATSVPPLPIATPTSARRSAGPSFTPSPVMATV